MMDLTESWLVFVLVFVWLTPSCGGTTPAPVSCIAFNVSNATYLPNQASFNDGDVVTYTCDIGYELTSGDLILTCKTNGTWNGTTPTCHIKTCAAVDIANGARSPLQSQYNYNTDVTYSCDVGFIHSSGDIVRTCTDSDSWNGTEPICVVKTCAAVDIANGTRSPLQSQYNYNTDVTYSCDVGFIHSSGDIVRTCTDSDSWNGTEPVCVDVLCSSNDITFGTKLPASSTVVFNTSVTYTCDVGYDITSGDAERTCQTTGDLSGTTPVCSIKQCSSEAVPNAAMSPSITTFDYNTTVMYACDVGYNHTGGDLSRSCQADTTWSGAAPICTIITCIEPANATFATKSPIQPSYDYSKQVTYTCDTGFNHDSGDLTRTCRADGTWSGALPACTIATCPAPSTVAFSSLSPVADPYVYNTLITYTCNIGYELTSGSLMRTCQANGAFSGSAPICTIRKCAKEVVLDGTISPDLALYIFNTSVTYTCNLGFNHTSGDLVRTCDATSTWTGTSPVCTVAACLPLPVTNGVYNPPAITTEFGSYITYTCNLGYYIGSGDANRTCLPDGSWTNTLPTCPLVRCNAPGPIPFSSHTPPGSLYDYNTVITYTCNLAYNHTAGNLMRTCKEDFTWSGTEPNCTIAACIQEDSTYMVTAPDKVLHEFNDVIIYHCILGYNHSSGDLNRTCLTDGIWTGIKPECVIVTCAKPNIPAHSSITPDVPEVNYNTYITYVCDLGYNRTDGDETRRCTEHATFEGVEANCTLVTCDPPAAISDGTYSPILVEHDYNTVVIFTCDFGYYHFSGDLTQRCDENANWVNPKPFCEIVKCSKPTEAHTTVLPDLSLYNFNTSVTSSCVIGYNLTNGDTTRTCLHTGQWGGTPPNCTIVECDAPPPVPLTSLVPVSTVYVYLDTLTYTCYTGYEVTSGNDVRTCTETAEWTGSFPNCTIIHCPIPPDGVRNTYSPILMDYIYNDTIVHTCDIGYNHSSGDLARKCLHDKTWSGFTPICTIVTCDKIDVPHMTFDPPTADTHDFNTTIEYSCDIGYNHTYGDLFQTCNYTGEWTGTLPNCTIIACDAPPPVLYSSLNPQSNVYVYLDTLTYSCITGYEVTSGNDVRTCTETTEWTGSAPNCTIIHCPIPPDGVRNTYSPILMDYIYNDTIVHTCDIGYNHSSGDLERKCLHDKTWSGTTPICTIVTCDKIDVPHMTFDPPTADTHDFNTTIEYSCDIGYNHTYGDLFRTCNYTGEWTGTLPNCTIIECDAPPPVLYSSLAPQSSKYVYLDTLTYTCITGYEVTSGNDIRTCTETAEWTGSAPNCTIIHCSIPPDGVRNTYSPILMDYIYNDTIVHTCDIGYNHSSGDLARKCLHDKTWSGVTPICTIVTCDKIDVPHMTFDPPTADTHDFNTTIEYSCDIGYNHTYGDLFRTCNYTGEWTGTLPNCTIIECDAPPPVLYSSLAPQSSKYVYLDTLTYTCITGYEVTSGNDIRTCTETTEWTGSAPNCTIIHCPIPPDGVRNTYSPILMDYMYNDTIVHTCDIGYNHSSGDLARKCLHDKTWSGVTPICTVVTCDKIDVPHMTFDPPTADTHDFNTTIEYSCDIGYNHTYGDLFRSCNYTGEWTGTLPNCTIIECDAPPPVRYSSLAPQSSKYVYLDTLTFTCITGYELTSGNDIRACTETAEWTGSAPNCTIIHCPIPPDGVRNTYTPELMDYIYNDTIVHTCDIGYNHSSGDLERKCLYDKTWSGVTPVCTIVTCDKIDVLHMTFDPPTTDTHDFNTTIEYSCDIGYNHTFGDLFRTCNYTAEWTGTLPNCTIITCDPPDPIPHTSYVPVLAEHNWNTSIHYSCDVDYHYVSGVNVTTCNESGSFPPANTDCSVQHYMTIHGSEPAVTWYNATVNKTDTIFDFDGMCDVIISCVPNLNGMSHIRNGSQLIMTVTQTASTVLNEYLCTLKPFHGERNFPYVSRDVFFGNEILDFQAFLDNPIIYLAVGETYTFIANATDGSNVTIKWEMESNVTEIQSYPGAFSTGILSYTFNRPKHNITVHGWNMVSNHTLDLYVEVIYRINGFTLSVDDTLANTTHPVFFDLHLLQTASIPMHDVNISINFKHGSNATDSRSIDDFYSVNVSHNYNHLFDMQGNYFVEATVENVLGYEVYSITMRIWDSLLPLQLELTNAIGGKYLITDTTAVLNFTNVPNYGYKYSINYGDGDAEANVNESILYKLYDLPLFMHNYTSPGVYIVHWTAINGEPAYDRDEKFAVHVQNKVPDAGYTLEPLGKKYPWTIVQDMSIELNITLNNSVPIPTNATCVFNPDDGNSSVADLTFDKLFFEYSHGYRTEGLFNSTFICSNDVSNYVYTYDIEVRKFRASDLQIVYHEYVPLNVSDTVVVYFHIDNGGFVGIPKHVYLTWEYGDGNVVASELYDKPTFTHLYTGRGNYTFTVFVEALISNTTHLLYKSLRLGLMYFEYNTTVQFINTTVARFTMYGIIGTANYTIDFDDGHADETCFSNGSSGCDIHHLCPEYGYHIVQVVGTNGTFVEIDNLNITCDNPINFIIDFPLAVLIPNGTINAGLLISQNDLFLPWVTCYWNMGDPIKLETYGPLSQEVTYENPYVFPFQYIALGRHTITVHCWNLINDTRIETQIVVTNNDFLFNGVFDRFYSQETSPMYISSMLDTEIFSRLKIQADPNVKTHTNIWKLNISLGEANATRQGLLFTRGLVPEKQFNIILRVCFKEEPENCIFEPTYAKFVMPPPHAEIVGNTRRYVDRGAVTVDAYTLSYDPVFPKLSNLDFSWTCESFDAADFDEASNFQSINNRKSCSFTDISAGVITLDTSDNPVKSHYAVTVTVDNNRGKSAEFTQIAAVETDKRLVIKCKINCLTKVARSSKLQLIPDLPDNCPASFDWTLKIYSGSTYVDVDTSSFTTETGSNSRSLKIKDNTLEYGTWYLVSLTVTQSGITHGPAFYEFLTNRPPQGGFCRIIPFNETTLFPMGFELENTTLSGEYNLTAGIHVFNLTCGEWQDEGFTDNSFSNKEPLFYMFFLSYGDDSNDTNRQLLYFDPGQTSNLVSFQAGNVTEEYKATVVLRITDVFGDYTDVRYYVRPKPTLTTSDLADLSTEAIHLIISEYVEQFGDELIKANTTCDYRTISRKVMDIASVYNELALNTSSGVILSPEDLLSLGYQRSEDDDLLRWEDYWKIIVEVTDTMAADYLAMVAEKYAYMLHTSVLTWPPDKRLTLVAIETISRALTTTTSKLEFSNVTAAVLAAECADILARNLAVISDDRTFPNTEQLFTAAIGVWDLARNILAILQTVLTPNLPQNPSVEEMRNYLNYIMIFKTTEEAIHAPLSIQEQTFLAQKQLQKYYLLKYIKSEASKKALPHLTQALRNLTYVLGKLSELGEQELLLENDYLYISVEISPAFELFGKTVNRPRVALELTELHEEIPETCSASAISLKTIVFKHNPYFWGQFADRITSYLLLFEIEGASLTSDEITYRLENKVEASCKDQVPTYEVDDPNKMIYILVDRQHAEDDLLIFVRPNTSDLIYELYFNKDEKPNVQEKLYSYSTKMIKDGQMWTAGDGYKLLVKSSDYSETGKIWIGLKPLLETSGDLTLLTRKFCANVTSVSCLALRQDTISGDYVWDKDMCKVSLSSTRTETVCTCQNTDDIITAGTTSYIPFNTVNFISLDPVEIEVVGRSPVIGIMVAIVCIYVLLVIWAWREDVKDQYKVYFDRLEIFLTGSGQWSYSLMIDNDIADINFYIVRVFTGLRNGAGTQSKIAFVLVGDDSDTNIRILDDSNHIGFDRGSTRTFVMSTRKYLGDLISLRIWHDDSGGNNSSWYLNKIDVTDLNTGKSYVFVCNQWFDHDSGDSQVDRVLNAQQQEEVSSFQDKISYTLAEHHLWISVFIRPFKSNFSRIQRISCLLGLIYLNMIVCTMFLKTSDDNTTLEEVVIGHFRFSRENFETAILSVTISSVIIIFVIFFFKNAESGQHSPNRDSIMRKAYRKINEKLNLDKSVLARKYWSPAEKAVEYTTFFLPHMCVYVGWTILAMAVILATYMLETFSPEWALVKSQEWMTTMFVSIICSIIFIEGAKVIIILMFYSLLCHRAYEPPKPHIDTDSLEEITRYNSATLTIGPQFDSVLHKPESPSEETLLANKIKRIQTHQLLKIVCQLAVYGALLYMVYTISYESRDPRSFYLKNHVENIFQFTSEVTDLESYTTWLKTTFIDTYFSSTFFGAEYESTENKMYMEDLTNYRIGPARLRQLRIRPEECIGPLGKDSTCHNKYEEAKKETKDFCLGWKEQPCPVAEISSFFTSTAWEFTSADEVWGFPTIAKYCTYGGGGYFMKLDVNRDVCEIIFNELLQFSWFDEQTRAVILEFTLYNVNTNLFVYSKFVAEFPEVGGFLPYLDIQVFRLYLNTGPDGDFTLLLQFFFLLVVIAVTFVFAYEIATDIRGFFKSVWNILDITALLMSYITISIFIYKTFVIKKTIEVFENDKNAYVGFENLAFYDFVTNTAYGVLVFLLSVRVSRILGYSGKINEMAAVISNAGDDLCGFLLIFGITYLSFVLWGTLLFGKEQEEYMDIFETYGTLTEAIIGKNRVSDILTAKPGFAEFYYFTFVLFVLMTLATMAAAILNFSIAAVKKEQQKFEPSNIVELIFDALGDLLKKLWSSDDQKSVDNKGDRRGSDPELDDILSDLRIFMHNYKSKH